MKERELRPAMKLTVCVGESERHGNHPLYREVLRSLREAGISGATLTKGVMSYGLHHRIYTNNDEVRMENLPVIIEVVDERAKVELVAALVADMLGDHGLVEIQPTMVAISEQTTREMGEE